MSFRTIISKLFVSPYTKVSGTWSSMAGLPSPLAGIGTAALTYEVNYNVGTVKYLVTWYTGSRFNKDGSLAADIKSFKNQKELKSFIKKLELNGYVKGGWGLSGLPSPLAGIATRNNLRLVKVYFEGDDGSTDSILTEMAAHLTDDDIYNYYRTGRYFNLGSGQYDNMMQVKSVTILK